MSDLDAHNPILQHASTREEPAFRHDPEQILDQVRQRSIRWVRFAWTDNAGLVRAKAVTAEALPGALLSGVGLSRGQQALPMMMDAVVAEAGLSAVGEVRLVPDLATFRHLPYTPSHALVLANMQTLEGQAWAACPRSFLQRQVDRAAGLGFRVLASFESEFFLLRPAEGGWVPFDETNFAMTQAMNLAAGFVDEVLEALEGQGVHVEMYYPESGAGQHELSVRPEDGLRAADGQVFLRETIRGVSQRHGLKATFAPKPFLDGAGSGCHLHLSLWQGEENAFYDPAGALGLSEVARHFIGGLLDHLPALAAVTVPSVNSYRRLHPGTWAGAYACWGLDNREAAVRVCSSFRGREVASTNLELKTVDGTSNPYLALGAVLAAGLDGIARSLSPGDALQVSPAELSEEEQARRRIARLPRSLEEAVAHLEADKVLEEALTPELHRAFVAVRKAEAAYFAGQDPEEEVRLHRMRY